MISEELKKISLVFGVCGTAFVATAFGGESTSILSQPQCSIGASPKWSLEAGSGVLFGNVRDSHLDSYTVVPAVLTLSYAFEKEHLKHFAGGFFQGQTDLLLDGYYSRVTSGVESYIAGFHIGGRYNFTHFSNKLVPFFGATVGAAGADARQYRSNGDLHGLGQSFNFNFTLDAGVRYDFSDRWFARLSGQYTHYSNGGLSEPAHQNKAIDVAGPLLSVGVRF